MSGVDAVVLAFTAFPSAAVDEDEAGDGLGELGRSEEIEGETAVADAAVFDVFLFFDPLGKRGVEVDEFEFLESVGGEEGFAVGVTFRGLTREGFWTGEKDLGGEGEGEREDEEAADDFENAFHWDGGR